MIRIYNLLIPNLFDGEASGASATSGDGTATQGEVIQQDRNTHGHKKSGDMSNIVFGIQDEQAAVADNKDDNNKSSESETPEQKRNRYNSLINGEFKDFYTEDTQKMINRRFKETKGLEDKLSQYKPLYDALSAKYGKTDIADITKALNDDNAFWDDLAERSGFSDTDSYKEFLSLKRREEERKANESVSNEEEERRRTVQNWMNEAEGMKDEFPNFDLNKELENDTFKKLLKTKGITIRDAYRFAHIDDIVNNASAHTAESVKNNIANNIRATGKMPTENGANPQTGAVIFKTVPTTKAERAEVARRAMNGDNNIRF